jgi:Flp pilus assembly CpaF family ATPase
MVELPRKAKGQRPSYFSDPAVDKLLSMTMALAGEVSVLRDRMDTIEHLLERGEKVSREAIDGFIPDADLRARRDERRDQFIGIILKSLHEEVEEMSARSSARYDEAVAEVESN